MNKQSALEILGLPPSFTHDDLKKAWRTLVKKYHPDITGDAENFLKSKDAYEFLKDYRQKYPTENDWENLLSQSFFSEDYQVPNLNYEYEYETIIFYVSIFFIVIAIFYIFIQVTKNHFLQSIWYYASLTIASLTSSAAPLANIINLFKRLKFPL